MRPRLDLDIAVRDEDMFALENGLVCSGYDSPAPQTDNPIPEYLNSRLFTGGTGNPIPLHVHRNILNNMFLTVDSQFTIDMAMVWKEAQPFKKYHNIYVLKPELNILYLCEHGLKHDFDQMVYLYEIERLISHYKQRLDWKKLMALAQDLCLAPILYYGLYFAKKMLSADIPVDVLEKLKPCRTTLGEKIFISNTLRNKHSRYCSYPVYLAMRKGLLRKSNFVFRTLFPPGFSLKGYLIRLSRSILA